MASASAEPCAPSKAKRWPGLTRATGEADGVEALSGIGTTGVACTGAARCAGRDERPIIKSASRFHLSGVSLRDSPTFRPDSLRRHGQPFRFGRAEAIPHAGRPRAAALHARRVRRVQRIRADARRARARRFPFRRPPFRWPAFRGAPLRRRLAAGVGAERVAGAGRIRRDRPRLGAGARRRAPGHHAGVDPHARRDAEGRPGRRHRRAAGGRHAQARAGRRRRDRAHGIARRAVAGADAADVPHRHVARGDPARAARRARPDRRSERDRMGRPYAARRAGQPAQLQGHVPGRFRARGGDPRASRERFLTFTPSQSEHAWISESDKATTCTSSSKGALSSSAA
ncbi:hypothetical protein F01_210164 [Burkholderia cenocepacia]|nr:hypothetical protein F01_210164 [Burkholderia cenocepacia]